jgi:DNA-binding MarR family transcriptional regulator
MAISASLTILAMSESVQSVYRVLGAGKALKVDDIQRKTQFSPRTVRSAIAQLKRFGLIEKIPDLRDLRSHYYRLKNQN